MARVIEERVGTRVRVPSRSVAAIAWPTWGVAAGVYGGWLALTYWHAALPTIAVIALGAWLIAWHGSLQHETIHGHPTRRLGLDWCVGFLPLALYLPYTLYRESHLRHHRDGQLTDPLADPESFYVTRTQWRGYSPLVRGILLCNQTLTGRLLIGPALMVGRVWWDSAGRLLVGDGREWRIWAAHLTGVAIVLAWVVGVCGLSVGEYVLLIVYPGIALGLVRSFAEHRAADLPGHRSILVEAGPLLTLLFLGNNLHALHHAEPNLPWFRLPARYRAERERLARRNGGFVVHGYAGLLLRHLFKPIYHPVHPTRDHGSRQGA